MDWNDKKLPAPQWLALAALALLILIKFVVGGRMVVVTGLVQLATIIGSTAIGFAIGWLCSPKASAFRLIAAFAAVGLILLLGVGDAGLTGIGVTGRLSLIGFFAALGYWAGTALKSFAQRPTTFGSAQWATLPYLQDNGVIGESGIRLGRFATDEGSEPLHYDSDRHLLTIAPTRARKGTAAIIPNLLTYSGSALVVDPKGENAMITAAARKAMGQEICVVDTTASAQRKLAYPDELMRLHGSKQIIFIENHHPIVGIKQPWFDDPQLKTLGRNLRDPQSRPPLPQAKPESSPQTVTPSHWETRHDRTPKLAIRIKGQTEYPRQG